MGLLATIELPDRFLERKRSSIAQLLRMSWYRPVHRKSVPSQEVRALLAARKQMQIKAMYLDLEQTLRGLLRGFGLRPGISSAGRGFDAASASATGHVHLTAPIPAITKAF